MGNLLVYSRNKWPNPEYELLEEQGQPHERVFSVKCVLGKFEELAVSKSKKGAKRMAAEKMLNFLLTDLPKQEAGYEDLDEEAVEDSNAAYPNDIDAALQSLTLVKGDVPALLPPSDSSESRIITQLSEMDLESTSDERKKNSKSYELLAQLCQQEDYEEPSYYPLPNRGKAQPHSPGLYQCLLQINSKPVAVCYGTGLTKEEAQYCAAHNMLKILKVTQIHAPAVDGS